MKLTLPDALHARPANLVVRAASQRPCTVWIHKGDRRANAADILQVLGLGAARGDEISLTAEGEGHEEALAAMAALIVGNFDEDLVPETAAGAAAGIAIGEALVIEEEERSLRPRGTDDEERAHAQAAFARARQEVAAIVQTLPRGEAVLFEPEITILDALEPNVSARIGDGSSAEEAVAAEAVQGASDLIDDARRRLLDALAGSTSTIARRLEERQGRDIVLVVTEVTPSLVASLPANVVGILAATEEPNATGTTSHAAILARGRGVPLAYVPPHVMVAIEDGATLVVDTTVAPARVWSAPSEALIQDARRRRDRLAAEAAEAGRRAAERLVLVEIRVNVGSMHEAIPEGVEGIGLVRTEILFADRTVAPREEEQAAAYLAIARRTRGTVQIRLFDAGGDKPLPFLRAPAAEPDARGIALLRAHPDTLATQLRAIARAARAIGQGAQVRALIPLVRGEDDVEFVRLLSPGLTIAAMIETPGAAQGIGAIARAADAISIGTNDLAAETLGLGRGAAPDPLDPRVLAHVHATVVGAHTLDRKVTVCGEVAADPEGARILVGLGVDALSVSPPRFASLKMALSGATLEDCQAAAKRALSRSP